MTDPREVLRALSDGRFRSGEELAGILGCSRSAIWKHVRRLRQESGLQIDAVTGRGYRLSEPLELLDQALILDNLPAPQRNRLGGCHVHDVVESTNELALRAAVGASAPQAWFAEAQTGGRGRRGRSWYSPYGRNLYFSLLQPFDLPMHRLAGLSVAVGLALAQMLSELGLQGHGLKWPNDLHWRGGKLAGILIEARGESEGPTNAVIGIGLNVDLGHPPDWLEQEVSSLHDAGLAVGRNRLAAALLARTLELCERFAADGLAPLIPQWSRYGLYQNQAVCLEAPGRQYLGVLRGVDDDGGLRLEVEGAERVFHGGELSLRQEKESG